MGKQNFVQGGFSGKVGQLVGAPWHDIWTVRAFTKAANPRTPAQQANRARFAKRVEACKIALGANWKAPFWEHGNRPAWTWLMKAASQMYADDKNILEYVPLIPYGYTVEYPASDEPEISGKNVTIFFDSTDDLLGRVLSVLVWALKSGTEVYEAQICIASVTGTAGSWSATATLADGFEFGDDSYIAAVSRDDASHSNTTLYQPAVPSGTPIPTTVFTLSNPEIDFEEGAESVYFWFTPSEALPANTPIPARSGSLRGVLQGAWVTDALNSDMIESDGRITYFAENCLDPLGQRPMFVSGSSLTIQPFSFVSDGVKYKFEGATFDLSETPTAQKLYFPTTTYNFATDSENGIIIARDVQSPASGSMQFSVKAVDANLSVTNDSIYFNVGVKNGNLIMKDTASGRFFFGSQQTATMTYQRGVTMRGVQYTIDQSQTWTFIPAATELNLAFTQQNRVGLMWVDNLTAGWVYSTYATDVQHALAFEIDTPFTGTIVAGDWPQNWQTKGIVWSLESYSNAAELVVIFEGTYDDSEQKDGTFTFTAPEQTLIDKTIENSDGFKVKVTFGGDSYTETTPST